LRAGSNSKIRSNVLTIIYEPFSKGENVFWKWMGRKIHGVVEEIYTGPIEKEIKGKFIKRNGSMEKPAYLVRSEAGNLALKLHTELTLTGPDNFLI
jgi:hypothetical protein